MTPEELELILAGEDGLEPSSGFAGGVMAAVRVQAEEPAAVVRFPWGRFGAGLAGCLGMAGAGASLFVRGGVVWESMAPAAPEVGFAVAALLVSLAVVVAPRVRWDG